MTEEYIKLMAADCDFHHEIDMLERAIDIIDAACDEFACSEEDEERYDVIRHGVDNAREILKYLQEQKHPAAGTRMGGA